MNRLVAILLLSLMACLLVLPQTIIRRAGRVVHSVAAPSPVVFSDSASETQSASQVATKQWAHTVAGDYLIVAIGGKSARVVDSVKVWTGAEAKISLTEIIERSAQVPMACLYGVKNPPVGVDTIKVWFLSNCYSVCVSASYDNVNQDSPIGTAAFNSASGTAVTNTVAAGTTDLVVCMVSNKDTKTFAPTSPMTEKWEINTGNMGLSLCQVEGSEGTEGNVTTAGTTSGTCSPWKTIGIALKRASP